MAEKKSKKGSAYIVGRDSSAPGGMCEYKECPIKRTIYPGMTLVKHDNKQYHANCAIYAGIDFTVPTVPKQKRVD